MQTCSEVPAVEIFNQVGREAAIAQYNLICEIAQRRYEDSPPNMVPCQLVSPRSISPSGRTSGALHPGLGIQLCIDEQHEAVERVLARCPARKRAA